MVDICVIALVGLPASGKTTFCKTILKSTQFNIIHICYDEMFTFVPQSLEVAFKEERQKVLQKICQTIDCIQSNKWPAKGAYTKPFIIFCDDNNYYAGMRYEIYKICKNRNLSFGQMYFQIDLEDALSRNSIRNDCALPVCVIEQMNNRLEAPSPKNRWETNTFTTKSFVVIEEVHAFLKMCIQNPLKAVKKNETFSNGQVNVVHEIDLLLRKKIKELLLTTEGDVAKRAKLLNDKRKAILLDIKRTQMFEVDLEGILQRLLVD